MAIYYVSNTGNDSLSGTSEANAWLTINKVNASTFLPGDFVLFKRGDKWNEVFSPASSGSTGNYITFGSYGSGDKPIIHGYKEITGWTNEGGGIYSKADASFQSDMRVVTIDGVVRHKGRYPKTGYLTTTSTSGNTSVTSTSLPASPSFSGGEVVIIKTTWVIDRGLITSHSGGTVTYTGTSSYSPGTGWGFFVQNHPSCLTEMGDWWYDGVAKKLYMHFGGGTPSGYTVRAAYIPTLVNVSTKTYLKLEGLSFQYAHTNSVLLNNSANNVIDNCDILKSGMYGVNHADSGGFSDNATINDNLFEDVFDTSVYGNNVMGTVVTNNIISRNYKIPGTGNNGDSNHNAIGLGLPSYRCGSYTVDNNIITNTGYNGIYTCGSNNNIRKNIINGFCQTKEDGAGIYTYYFEATISSTPNTNNLWDRNIIINGVPNGNPTPYGSIKEVYGIYTDATARGITITNNVVDNCYCGIYVNKANNLTIQYNKINNFVRAGIFLNGTVSTPSNQLLSNLNIQYNQVHSLSAECLRINNYQSSISAFGTINNNYYLKPSGGTVVRKLIGGGSETTYSTIAAWSAAFSYDAGSLSSPTISTVSKIYYNDTGSTANVGIGVSRVSITGATLTSPQSIGSFDSIMVLEGLDEAPPAPTGIIESIGVYTTGTGVDIMTLSSASVGSLLVIIAHQYDDTTYPATPAGWTLENTTGRNRVFTRVKQSGDSNSTSFIRTTGFDYNLVYLVGFSLVGTLTSLTFGAAGSSNYAGSATLPSVTHPNSNPAVAFALAGSRYSNASAHTYSVGWEVEQRFEQTSGQSGVLSWSTKDLSSGGASGTAVVANDSDMQGLIFTVEIAPVSTSLIKIRVGGIFVSVSPKIRVGGSFLDLSRKIKVGGIFVDV